MSIILTEDLNKSLSKYDDKIYDCVKNHNSYDDSLRSECIKNTLEFYEVSNKDDETYLYQN